MEEVTRRYSKEEETRLMKEIMENNVIIVKLRKQIVELQIVKKEEERREAREAETRRQEKEKEETDRWIEECKRRKERAEESR